MFFSKDFPNVNWVVQLDCPEDTNTYIHRVGRTARWLFDFVYVYYFYFIIYCTVANVKIAVLNIIDFQQR